MSNVKGGDNLVYDEVDDVGKVKKPSKATVEIRETNNVPVIATVDNEGPVVTRKELWAYYRESS